MHREPFLQPQCRIESAVSGPRKNGGNVVTLLAFAACAMFGLFGCVTPVTPITGIVWQPDNLTLQPHGNWHQFGAHQLLVQWTAVDGVAYVHNPDIPVAEKIPDWDRIAAEPWANEVILGLAGRFDETAARADIVNLAMTSERLAKLPTPLHIVGWYFPVEIDPTWSNAAQLAPLLAKLPRPLWISVYDSANVGPAVLADSLAKWLPADIGVFFQDGVGVYAREAGIARRYADLLAARLGQRRVRLIAEAFRPKVGGGFRSATFAELQPQLAAYHGYSTFLFDGPHYVDNRLITELAVGRVATPMRVTSPVK